MRGIPAVLFSICLFVVNHATLATAQNWPEFRGPTGDGVALNAELPESIDQNSVKWETAIHGKGWSSPVVWDDQIWLTTATDDGKEMSVICVDRTSGKVLHDAVLIRNPEPAFCHATNSYASCTPAIEQGCVYLHFGSYLTACLNTETFEMIWERKDFQCDHHRGPASSPILHGDNLFVAYDGVDAQYVVAMNKETGETVWRTKREIDYGTDNVDWMKAYATGEVFSVDGQHQLVIPSASATVAYEPKTGKQLWTVYHGGMNASARPILANGLIYVANGMGEMVAVKTGGTGNVTDSHLAWSDKKAVTKKASPVVVDGMLYMNTDDGILSARHADSGKLVWRHRAGGSYAASPIYAVSANDPVGLIYFFSIEGDVITVRPPQSGSETEPQIVAQTKLGDGFMASPAVVGNDLIVRSKSKLYCLAKSVLSETKR